MINMLLINLTIIFCLDKSVIRLADTRNNTKENLIEAREIFLDWMNRKFDYFSPSSRDEELENIRLSLFANKEYKYIIESLSENFLEQKIHLISCISAKVFLEYFCIYFFKSNMIYNSLNNLETSIFIFLRHPVCVINACKYKEFLIIFLEEYFLNTNDFCISMFESNLEKAEKKSKKKVYEGLYYFNERLLSLFNIYFKCVFSNSYLGKYNLNKKIITLVSEIFRNQDFQRIKKISPEIIMLKDTLFSLAGKYTKLKRIYFMLMILLSKMKTINLILSEDEDEIFKCKFLPIYKIRTFLKLKFSIRCYQYYLYKSLFKHDIVCINYLESLVNISYEVLKNEYFYLKNTLEQKEKITEKDYINHLINYSVIKKKENLKNK
ncbi:hypothetical protein TUBRATIS_30660 [Tubulinosema ratisbonensis]|uniref:Uncharacterized protein n=1 Tax=Tubulinosema ratisbonensis TaxID=291195 RepID=A0A437AHB8_9MICR|nr:hypothetical protein TUBRATIS_30660 [Tubulinosema ratisbonensis]